MEKILAPSILSADFGILESQLKMIDEAGAQYVHFDVMDGVFVPSISFGLPVLKSIRKYTKRIFDVHLMIIDPDKYVQEFIQAGADIVTFHAEASKDLDKTISLIREAGAKVGVALSPATPVSTITGILDKVDMVLIMTVNPGFGGQSLIPETIDKVRELKAILDHKQLRIDIEVDGGIKADNVHILTEAGANVIVAGSAVFSGDIKANTKAIMENM